MTAFPSVQSIAQKQVLFSNSSLTVAEASMLMDESNLSSLIVADNDQHYIFSIEALLVHLANNGDGHTRLSELTLPVLPCITENQHVLAALECLESSAQRYLGVTQHNALTGILTYTDLLAAISPTVLIEKKTVGELLSKSELVTFSPDWILEDILCHFKCLEDAVVVAEDGVALGIITTKDVFRLIANRKSLGGTLPEYMTSPVITTRTTASIQEALAQLKSHNIKRSVVVNDGGDLVGVITQSELIGFTYGTWINLTKYHSGELREVLEVLDLGKRADGGASQVINVSALDSKAMLQQKLAQEINRICRYRCAPFSFVLFAIECRQAEVAFNASVQKIAAELPRWVRNTDGIALWNTNSFAVLLPQTPGAGGEVFAARIRTCIEHLLGAENAVRVSSSIRQIDSKTQLDEFLADADLFAQSSSSA